MAKEYIEREALLNIFEEDLNYQEKNGYWQIAKDIRLTIDKICNTPAADVAPVEHGEWIPIVSYFHGKPTGQYYCSVCHRVEDVKGIYCRLCGARMDGGKKL